MLTAAEIIAQMRTYDGGLVREHHPDQLCLPYLNTLHRQLVGEVAQLDRDAISAEITISLPLADFDAGEELLDGGDPIQYEDLQPCDAVQNSGRKEELRLIQGGRRYDTVRFPAAYLRGGRLFPVGQENDWNPYQSLLIRYFPTPGDFATTAAEVVLPDNAMDALSWRLAAMLALRKPDTLDGEPAALVEMASAAEKRFLTGITRRRPSKGRVKDVY